MFLFSWKFQPNPTIIRATFPERTPIHRGNVVTYCGGTRHLQAGQSGTSADSYRGTDEDILHWTRCARKSVPCNGSGSGSDGDANHNM